MQLGETIATYDLGLALRGECGKFEVTGPAGEVFHVICKPNHSHLEWAGGRTNSQPFLVRKIIETVLLESGKGTPATQACNEAPFLVASQPDDGEPLFAKGSAEMSLKTAEETLPGREMASLELVYLENDAETKQPRVWVAVMGARAETVMTLSCATFNELDAEIRKLHAQLDQIRARAKKKFYLAHAAAATA
jgi:hypothetical protein